MFLPKPFFVLGPFDDSKILEFDALSLRVKLENERMVGMEIEPRNV